MLDNSLTNPSAAEVAGSPQIRRIASLALRHRESQTSVRGVRGYGEREREGKHETNFEI
jgi:hypothetical protein